MNVSAELLAKYFRNQCSPEEKLLVANYLKEIEELPDHLAPKDEWDDAQDAYLSNAKSDELLEAIKKQTFAKTVKFKWIRVVSAAAILLVLFTFGFLLFTQNKPFDGVAKTARLKQTLPREINWKSIVNYTEKSQVMTLPDQSTVKIYPGGELRYAIPFIKNKREIYLRGKSFFQVTKDKKHPFIVYANGISTTALGTSFTITATDKSKFIKVQLHTGKVWIKDADSSHRILTFSRILLPGNELVYNRIKNEVSVSQPKTLLAKKPAVIEVSFTQASLVDVFVKLEAHYKIKINYDPADLQEMSFTGTLNLAQPINKILTEITELNKLNQTKTQEGYLIKK
jgi:transmembrane sensor